LFIKIVILSGSAEKKESTTPVLPELMLSMKKNLGFHVLLIQLRRLRNINGNLDGELYQLLK
jgi:hypothetical protein